MHKRFKRGDQEFCRFAAYFFPYLERFTFMKLYSENTSFVHRFVMSVVDGWSSLLRFYSIDHDPSGADRQVDVEDGIEKLLNLFEKHEVKTTFFCYRGNGPETL